MGGRVLGGRNLQVHILDVRTHRLFIHVLWQMRQRREHSVVVRLVQPPANEWVPCFRRETAAAQELTGQHRGI